MLLYCGVLSINDDDDDDHEAIIICPIAIAYSMGQIIKSVCACQCVCVSMCVRLRALSLSHFLINFHQNWHRGKNPQKKNEFVRGQYRTIPSLILPTKTPILGQDLGPENQCKY